jgi:exopolysaccharide biosynthesis polyprenyl glycosylphosphotransferase
VEQAKMTRATIAKSVTEVLVESDFALETPGLRSIKDRFHWIVSLIEILADVLTVAGAVFFSYAVYRAMHLGHNVQYSAHSVWTAAFAISIVYVILMDRDGAYRPGNSLLRIKESETSLRVAVQTFLLVLPVTFFANLQFPRWVFLIALILAPVLQIAQKQLIFLVLQRLRSAGIGVKRAIIYGAGTTGRRAFSALARSPKLGLRPVALIDDDPRMNGQDVFDYSYRRDQKLRVTCEEITTEMLQGHRCDFLVLATEKLEAARFAQIAQAAREANVRLGFLSSGALGNDFLTDYADLDGIMLNVVGQPERDWYYEAAKRPFDILGALALIALTAPALLVIALLVRLDSPGPILFRQKRVGIKGKHFEMFKFRSMHVNAPQYAFSPKESVDSRITRVGRFLRRTSLDELPQLLNVVKGDMSLVGPRPEMPFIVDRYDALQRQRLAVRPGITGLWQLSADRSEQIHENIQYDLYYITHRSFFMDCAVLIHTLLFAMHGV